MLKIDACPVCGGGRLKKVMDCVDRQVTGEKFALCRCLDCGFMLTRNAPVEEEIGRYYDSPSYIPHSDTNRGIMGRAYHLVRRIMLMRKGVLVKRCCHLSRGSLLDIGTGTGYFPDYMHRIGWTVNATEKSAQARQFAAERFGLDVMPPDAVFLKKEEEYDAITMWHVTEHLERLDRTWYQAYKSLKKNGVLIVAVPNPSGLDAGVYGKDWAAYDVPRHLWHFTPSAMQRYGAKHGFVLAERHTMPFDAFYVSMLTEKQLHHFMPILRGFIVGLQGWAASLVKKDKSSSMTYVFRKKTTQ